MTGVDDIRRNGVQREAERVALLASVPPLPECAHTTPNGVAAEMIRAANAGAWSAAWTLAGLARERNRLWARVVMLERQLAAANDAP